MEHNKIKNTAESISVTYSWLISRGGANQNFPAPGSYLINLGKYPGLVRFALFIRWKMKGNKNSIGMMKKGWEGNFHLASNNSSHRGKFPLALCGYYLLNSWIRDKN